MAGKDGQGSLHRVWSNGEVVSQHSGKDCKLNGGTTASPFRTSTPLGSLPSPQLKPTYPPPTPAFGQSSSFGAKRSRDQAPSPEVRSSFGEKATPSEDENPPAKRMKLDFTDVLRIEVGPEKSTFYVPRRLATSRSTLLATTTSEGQKALALPYDDAQVFSTWVQIILQGHVVLDDQDNVLEKEQQWDRLVKTYLLAARLGDVQSMNACMDEVVRRLRFPTFKEEPIAQVVKYAFEHTERDSKLRRVFVDFAVYRTSDRNLFSEGTSNDFLSAVAQEYMNWRDSQPVAQSTFGRGRGKFGDDPRLYHVKDAAGAGVKQ